MSPVSLSALKPGGSLRCTRHLSPVVLQTGQERGGFQNEVHIAEWLFDALLIHAYFMMDGLFCLYTIMNSTSPHQEVTSGPIPHPMRVS